MLDVSKLNDHSREFAQRLFTEFPDWLKFARFDPYEDFEKEALLVEVPGPAGNAALGLFITTSEWEVSIGFGENFHTRFGASDDPQAGNFYDDAIQFLHDFVNEKVILATAWQGKEWLGAWKIYPDRQPIDAIDREEGVVVVLRSWRGTYNQEIG